MRIALLVVLPDMRLDLTGANARAPAAVACPPACLPATTGDCQAKREGATESKGAAECEQPEGKQTSEVSRRLGVAQLTTTDQVSRQSLRARHVWETTNTYINMWHSNTGNRLTGRPSPAHATDAQQLQTCPGSSTTPAGCECPDQLRRRRRC